VIRFAPNYTSASPAGADAFSDSGESTSRHGVVLQPAFELRLGWPRFRRFGDVVLSNSASRTLNFCADLLKLLVLMIGVAATIVAASVGCIAAYAMLAAF